MPNASQREERPPIGRLEQELVLGFSQGIFKRLYELNLSEPLRLEALVALLENINTYCPKSEKIWVRGNICSYEHRAAEKAAQTVLLLLAQSSPFGTRPDFAARADSGGIIC
jgi:hypothetical protein